MEFVKQKYSEEIEQIKIKLAHEVSNLQTEQAESKRLVEKHGYQILGLEKEKENFEKDL